MCNARVACLRSVTCGVGLGRGEALKFGLGDRGKTKPVQQTGEVYANPAPRASQPLRVRWVQARPGAAMTSALGPEARVPR